MSNQIITSKYSLYNADTIDVARALPSKSVHFSIFSPPFSSLFTFSNSPRDMGNCRGDKEFFEHFDYLIAEQKRIMKPGRLVAIHCMDMPTSKEMHGHIGLRDFPGDIIRAYEKHGFIYHSRVCIWKCPVTAVVRSKAIGLLHKQLKKDSSISRQGLSDSLILMRMPDANQEPITQTMPVSLWQRYASPVWACIEGTDAEGFVVCTDREVEGDDTSGIRQGDTLQHRSAREHEDEKHIAPLQLGVIRRAIKLWSNPNDIVWSPFAGIGSEGYVAIQEGRRFVGAELKRSYYEQAVRNLEAATHIQSGGLFGALP